MIVYRATPSARTVAFGLGTKVDTWREANRLRSSIAKAALSAKDNSFPIVYDDQGNFVVADWQKGFDS